MADETDLKTILAITSTQSTWQPIYTSEICHVSSRPQSDTLTDNQDLPLTKGELSVCISCIRSKNRENIVSLRVTGSQIYRGFKEHDLVTYKLLFPWGVSESCHTTRGTFSSNRKAYLRRYAGVKWNLTRATMVMWQWFNLKVAWRVAIEKLSPALPLCFLAFFVYTTF